MRPTCACLLLIALAAVFISSSAHYISDSAPISQRYELGDNEQIREKRQVETFDSEDYPTAPSEGVEDEPSFWDRVVKVAMKLFSRFIEWLNTS